MRTDHIMQPTPNLTKHIGGLRPWDDPGTDMAYCRRLSETRPWGDKYKPVFDLFSRLVSDAPKPWQAIAYEAPSTTSSEVHAWLLRQRDRELVSKTLTVENAEYLSTAAFQISRAILDRGEMSNDDRATIAEWAGYAAQWKLAMIGEAITWNAMAYDGLPLRSKERGNEHETLASGGRWIREQAGESGLLLGLKPAHILCAPCHEEQAQENARAIEGSVIIIPNMTEHFLCVAAQSVAGMTPFLVQERRAPELRGFDFTEDGVAFVIAARGAAAPAMPQMLATYLPQ
jgi:hypothetical protein